MSIAVYRMAFIFYASFFEFYYHLIIWYCIQFLSISIIFIHLVLGICAVYFISPYSFQLFIYPNSSYLPPHHPYSVLFFICFQAISLYHNFLLVVLVYSASHLLTFFHQIPDTYIFSQYFYLYFERLVIFPPLLYLDTTAQNRLVR